ncbi:glutathionylspermidine synthase family protein [Campylobacter sp. RM12327]|uniref:glutathionylspermidine synthase family protein n=1 Tax=Campylobacter sputorum TaxID=206 RepID=UPI000B78589D|nr:MULTISPECIES: glutathionylspermidine synthase family protein [Campylobacter]ASM40544.1 glutathionylspermidine amidase / glutathionylspermidine synthetase [Campylobacter sputorum]MBE7357791.1 glutathionylspermidine synthase family protein [Campylobacter sp. RM11302]MBF6669069.1 glutathionylspermidine synthase family protein [Campylobacter sp. RM12327]MBF6673922.1 glutathionylspermidine synthase family protein [Campylobacter sp. RM13538]MBF6675809.1 glutathionylspermidine synthase family prot
MLNLQKIKPLTKKFLEDSNFTWHTDLDNTPYISDEILKVSQSEANAYYEAANELYDMFVTGAEHVIENNLFHELGIPFNLIDIIKDSWSNDVHWHLYGRFDFAGGLDGKPIKLLEFNADTPTSLFETTIIQWAMLKYNGMNEMEQFNDIYEAIKENFKRLITLSDDTSEFSKYYDGWKILFSSIAGSNEDEQTVKLLQNMADEAGFHTKFAYVDEVGFSDEEGVFLGDEGFEYWFKLIPWEEIAINEGELALIIKNIIKNQKAIILNPAYTLLFQSKAMMKILWDLYPNHPLLLETSFEPLNAKKQVVKPFLGREGANISILDENAKVIESKDGDYANQNKIYQEFYELNKDEKGQNYQAGVFFAYEGCGLGFRRGGNIIDNYSKFVGHFIKG